MLRESEMVEALAPRVHELLRSPEILTGMKAASGRLARPDAATEIAQAVLRLAGAEAKA